MKTKIAVNIKFYRKQMHLTQAVIAEMLNGKKALYVTMKRVSVRRIFTRFAALRIYSI